MQFKDRVAVVTGGASGIGAASARCFAARGAKVAAVDLNGDGAKAVAEEIGGIGLACDVGSKAAIDSMVATVEEKLGPIDIFFHNAGIATGSDPLETGLDVWQTQWDVNLMAHLHATRAVLPGMLARGRGYLIHTASMAGILTSHGNLPYAVTKHAVVGFAEWMAVTYHDRGIGTSLLAPLGVRTPMLGDTGSPFARNAAGPIREPEEGRRDGGRGGGGGALPDPDRRDRADMDELQDQRHGAVAEGHAAAAGEDRRGIRLTGGHPA